MTDRKLAALVQCVNDFRYRGVDGRGPMVDNYRWPQSFDDLQRIANAALVFVLAREAAERLAGGDGPSPPQDALLHPAHQVFFRAGLIACREYMARFVEAESPSIANSIRANWWPQLGPDYGPPRQLRFDEVTVGEFGAPDFRPKTADELSPTRQQYTRLTAPIQIESADTEDGGEGEWCQRSQFWHPGVLPLPPIVMLNLYCDESHDNHTYAIAGWLAVPGAKQDYGWDGFTAAWRRALSTIQMPDGSPCPAIHVSEIYHRRKTKGSRFKGWKGYEAREALDKAVDVIVDREACGNMWPIGSSMAVPPDASSWMPEGVDRTIWMLLFVHLFHLLLTKYPPQNGISLMFDEKPEVQAIVNEHYTQAKKIIDGLLPGKLHSPTVAFGDDKDHPPLQAADLFAYEWRKQITTKRLNPHATRREHYGRLRDGRPLNPQLHHFNAEAMRSIKASVPPGQSLIGAMLACPTTED